jgi:hypothetical protein
MHACDGALEKRRAATVTDGGATKVSMYLEQERLFQEQFKDDVMERRHGTAQVESETAL